MAYMDIDLFTPLMEAEYPDDEILALNCAVGGSSIDEWDLNDYGDLYEDCMEEIDELVGTKTLTSAAMLWH
jgi:hypothetical protein